MMKTYLGGLAAIVAVGVAVCFVPVGATSPGVTAPVEETVVDLPPSEGDNLEEVRDYQRQVTAILKDVNRDCSPANAHRVIEKLKDLPHPYLPDVMAYHDKLIDGMEKWYEDGRTVESWDKNIYSLSEENLLLSGTEQ